MPWSSSQFMALWHQPHQGLINKRIFLSLTRLKCRTSRRNSNLPWRSRADASKFHGIRTPSLINTAASARCGGPTLAFSRFNGFSECNGKPLKRLEFLPPTIHRAEAAVLMRKLDDLDAFALLAAPVAIELTQ